MLVWDPVLEKYLAFGTLKTAALGTSLQEDLCIHYGEPEASLACTLTQQSGTEMPMLQDHAVRLYYPVTDLLCTPLLPVLGVRYQGTNEQSRYSTSCS
jgi:hypothetical protein